MLRHRFARTADALFFILLALAFVVGLTGGARVGRGWYRVSLKDPIHVVLVAVAIVLARHAVVWRPSLLDRLRALWENRAPAGQATGGLHVVSPRDRHLVFMRRLSAACVRAFSVLFLAAATLLVLPFPGTGDVRGYWLPWMDNLDTLGVVHGFAANHGDYPPGSSIILSTVARLAHAVGADDFTALKWSILVFLCLTSLLFWLWTRNFRLAVVFHLALLFQSLALGYLDVYFAPLFVAALWALNAGRLTLFGVCFSLACLTKWQPLILVPFVVLHLANIQDLRDWRRVPLLTSILRVFGPAALLGLTAVAIFGPPVLQAFDAATSHQYFSGNALNFCWVITHWVRVYRPEAFGGLINGQADLIVTRDLRYTLLPKILFIGSYAAIVVLAFLRRKTFPNFLRFGLLGYLAYFTFNTGVHENHLFLAVILGVLLYWQDKTQAGTAVAIALLSNINLFLFYGLDGSGYRFGRVAAGTDVALLLALAATFFFLTLWVSVAMDTKDWADVRVTL